MKALIFALDAFLIMGSPAAFAQESSLVDQSLSKEIDRFSGNTRGSYILDPSARLSNQLKMGLSVPQPKMEKIPDELIFISGCKKNDCSQKAALVLSKATKKIISAAIISNHCVYFRHGKNSCAQHQTLTIFRRNSHTNCSWDKNLQIFKTWAKNNSSDATLEVITLRK